jgi:hypothetical protein
LLGKERGTLHLNCIKLQLYQLLYGLECWTLTKETQRSRIKAAEMLFLRAVAAYRLLEPEDSANVRKELEVVYNKKIGKREYQIRQVKDGWNIPAFQELGRDV